MKLLHCSANVPGMPLLDLEGAFGRIRSRLESVSSDWVLRPVTELTIDDLAVEIVRPPPANLFHFDGHGTIDGGLLFRSSEAQLPMEAFRNGIVDMLAPQGPALRLAVLLSCHSARLGEGLAGQLGAAVAIEGEVLDVIASPFAPILYTHLSLGRSLAAAFASACGRLRAQFSNAARGKLHLFTNDPERRFPSAPPARLQIVIETSSDYHAVLVTRTPKDTTPVEIQVEGRGRQHPTPESLVTLRIERGEITLRVHAPPESEFVGRPATVVVDGDITNIASLQPLPDQHLGSDEGPCILDLRFKRQN